MKKMNEDFILVGHLQVMDEALSSLYSDRTNGKFFLFVRIYEDCDDNTYLLSEVLPSAIIDYMDGKIGLKQIFSFNPSFYYKRTTQPTLYRKDFQTINAEEAHTKLLESSSLDDFFSMSLACDCSTIKNYLRKALI